MSNPLDWAKLGTGVLSGIGDFLSGNQNQKMSQQQQAAYLALAQQQQAQQARQFGLTSAENQREFNATDALNRLKFSGQQENTQFDRNLNAKYAAVRGPIVSQLASGQNLRGANNPAMSKYAALLGGGTPAPTGTPMIDPRQQTPNLSV